MKAKTILISIFLLVSCLAFSQVSYKMQTKDPVTKKIKTVDITKEYKALKDSLIKIKELKEKPNIYMPIIQYDSGYYRWARIFKPLTIDTSHVYMVIINPDKKPLNFKYYAKNAQSNIIPKRVVITTIRNTNNPNDPWECDKDNLDMQYQGEHFYLTMPQKSFTIISIQKKYVRPSD
jgi:hypothetical protein